MRAINEVLIDMHDCKIDSVLETLINSRHVGFFLLAMKVTAEMLAIGLLMFGI